MGHKHKGTTHTHNRTLPSSTSRHNHTAAASTVVLCASGHLRTNWLATAIAQIQHIGAVGVFWDTVGMYNTLKLKGVYDNRLVNQTCPPDYRCEFEHFPAPHLANRTAVVTAFPAINARMMSMYYIMVRSFRLGRRSFPGATWYMRIRPDCHFVRPLVLPTSSVDLHFLQHMYWPDVPNDMVFLVRHPRPIESDILPWMERTRLDLKQAEFIITRFASSHNMSFELGREGRNHVFRIERTLPGERDARAANATPTPTVRSARARNLRVR